MSNATITQALFGYVEPAEAFEYKILTESKDSQGRVNSVTIRTPLQRLNKVNHNNRIYETSLMKPHIDGPVKKLIEGKHLVGEAGHPIAEYIAAAKENDAVKRIVDIDPKAVSHTFNKIWIDGDLVMGEVRTLQGTQYGREMRDMIILDRLNLGFSLRSIGQAEKVNGIEYVRPYQFRFITYDMVFNPSNGDDATMKPSDIILTESIGINTGAEIQTNPTQVCFGNRCALMESLSSSRMSEEQKRLFYKESLMMSLKKVQF